MEAIDFCPHNTLDWCDVSTIRDIGEGKRIWLCCKIDCKENCDNRFREEQIVISK